MIEQPWFWFIFVGASLMGIGLNSVAIGTGIYFLALGQTYAFLSK